jgi:peptidyl-prolyl cis-trans isomerase A (cyclophilin A)
MKFNTTLLASALCAGLFTSQAEATIVTLETSVGNIDINLYDEATPLTVANFLAYVNTGAYDHTFIHRLIPGFVVQGGGWIFNTGTGCQRTCVLKRSWYYLYGKATKFSKRRNQ